MFPVAFEVAATQLSLIHSPCQIAEVHLDISCLNEEVQDHCTAIDEALATDNFPSLRRVLLHYNTPYDYFPSLQSRGILEVFEW